MGVSLPTLAQDKSCLLQLDQPVFCALLPSPCLINELGCTMQSMVLCKCSYTLIDISNTECLSLLLVCHEMHV